MTPTDTLRIDTAIKPVSSLRALLYVSLSSVLILLAWLAELALFQYVVILVIAVAVASYLMLSRPIVLHLSQPPLDQHANQGWQLLIRSSKGDALWQADLSAIQRYPWVISFEFTIVEPYQRSLSMVIFRDQVSHDQWRELSVLANVMSHSK